MSYITTRSDTRYEPRRRYLVRELLDPLLSGEHPPDEWMRADSTSPLIGKMVPTLVDDDPTPRYGYEPARVPLSFEWTHANSTSPLLRQISSTLVGIDLIPWYQLEPQQEPVIATTSLLISELAAPDVQRRILSRTLDALLESAKEERFEDGMNSNLSVGLRVLLRKYSTDFIRVLEDRLKGPKISSRILTEVLHTLGDIEDATTKGWRLATLVRFLASPSSIVRDAAATGLAYLDDKTAIPYLREAIARESSVAFREDLRAIVEQLSA